MTRDHFVGFSKEIATRRSMSFLNALPGINKNPASHAILFTFCLGARLLDLWKTSINTLIFDNMNHSYLPSYLRTHRKRSGLSQREIANLLGYPDEGQVSRHERLASVPPFLIALGYQAIFRVPISDLFPGVYETAKQTIEERLVKMEHNFQQYSAKGRNAAMIARKLEWMRERQNPEQSDSIHASEIA